MTVRFEDTLIANLVFNEEYSRKVSPHIKSEYFPEKFDKILVETSLGFFQKYNKLPTREVLSVEVSNRKDLNDTEHRDIQEIIHSLKREDSAPDWLLEKTEEFVKKRAVYNGIVDSIAIIDGQDKNRSEDAIPDILSKALAVSFDTAVGHDYIDDAMSRYEFYHRKEEGIKFDIDLLNLITGGVGLRKKTLSCLAAPTGAGKSLAMVHFSASTLAQGKNVLYISMEMSEERICERVDANMMGVKIGDLRWMTKDTFQTKIDKIAAKSVGKLVVKEYPTSQAHAGHFRALLEELKMKKNFKPDLVVIDYLNICASQRLKAAAGVNSYLYIKAIAEELRGLAVEYDVPILTATQVNRNGIGNSDIEMTDTSESMGLVHSLDLFLALIRTEELDELNQMMIKQLKNRYGDINFHKRFVVGVDRAMMKMYNLEEVAQENISGGFKPPVAETPASPAPASVPWEKPRLKAGLKDPLLPRDEDGTNSFKF